MPSPRATIFQRQAQHTVIRRARPAAAASARTSTVRMPSRNGPVPRRQTRTANVTAVPAKRTHAHAVRLIPTPDSARGRTSRSAWSTVTASCSGRCLRQAPARVGVRLGGQLVLLLARGAHPAGEPLRRQRRPGRRRVARGWAGRGPPPPAAERLGGGRDGVRAEQAALRSSRGAGGRRMRRPRGRRADPAASARRDRRRTGSAARGSPRRHRR